MDCSSILRSYSRYMLVFFNLIIVITGIILLTVGISVKAYYREFDTFLDPRYFYVSDLLIIIGIVVFLVAFFGCCGAVKENACMTTTFSVLLIIVFLLEVAVAICGILLRSKTEAFLVNTLQQTITEYGNNSEVTEIWDKVQRQFKCCGITSSTDWDTNNHTNNTVPLSCCNIPPGSYVSYQCTKEQIYPVGCLSKLGDFVRSNTSIVEGVGIGLAVVQLLGILFSCYLAKSIRRDYETV